MAETNESWLARKDDLLAAPMQELWKANSERIRIHRQNGTKPETGLFWFDFFFIRHHFVPNVITIARSCLTPLLYMHLRDGNNETAFFIFTTAVLSDLIDGILARGFFCITKFGKFTDPIADKLLTAAVIFGFKNDIPSPLFWSILGIALFLGLITILLLVLKMLGRSSKRSFGTSSWGKYKFAVECAGYAFLFLYRWFPYDTFSVFAISFLWASVPLGIASILGYLAPSVLAKIDSYKT